MTAVVLVARIVDRSGRPIRPCGRGSDRLFDLCGRWSLRVADSAIARLSRCRSNVTDVLFDRLVSGLAVGGRIDVVATTSATSSLIRDHELRFAAGWTTCEAFATSVTPKTGPAKSTILRFQVGR